MTGAETLLEEGLGSLVRCDSGSRPKDGWTWGGQFNQGKKAARLRCDQAGRAHWWRKIGDLPPAEQQPRGHEDGEG